MKPGWYGKPGEEARYFDGREWRPDVKQGQPVRRSSILAAVIAAVAVIWWTGALDEPLSVVHLNKNTCVENLFGNKMCGDQAEAFCTRFYDEDVNADVCDEVLGGPPDRPERTQAEQERGLTGR